MELVSLFEVVDFPFGVENAISILLSPLIQKKSVSTGENILEDIIS